VKINIRLNKRLINLLDFTNIKWWIWSNTRIIKIPSIIEKTSRINAETKFLSETIFISIKILGRLLGSSGIPTLGLFFIKLEKMLIIKIESENSSTVYRKYFNFLGSSVVLIKSSCIRRGTEERRIVKMIDSCSQLRFTE
jgi:hypothetical protein